MTFMALPSLAGRSTSVALPEAEARRTRLGQAISPRTDAHPGLAGVVSLEDAREAFATRMLLAAAAERTIDVQYYIWHADLTGTLLFDALRAAADRGVRVRLLLDDNNTAKLDATLSILAAHPKIEVRLFNPFVFRSLRLFGYLFGFSTANRRMHNKSFTVDNQATIVGGRNVGNEYFDASNGVVFTDLDVLAVGDVVRAVSADFDRYWASRSAYPAESILPVLRPETLGEYADAVAKIRDEPHAADYIEAVRSAPHVDALVRGDLDLQWAPAQLVSDDPAKGLGRAAPKGLLTYGLRQILREPSATVDLISPYFVPTKAGVEYFTAEARRGIAIRILTNSLESTDVVAVHAGYAKRRKVLLKAGVILYEMRRSSGRPRKAKRRAGFGSSGSSLHAKTFAVDQTRIFVGSFNFDPRSAKLNTEMGVVIDSPQLARHIDTVFDDEIPLQSYEVRLTENGKLYWLARDGEQPVRYDVEPGATLWRRAVIFVLSRLPIEWLL